MESSILKPDQVIKPPVSESLIPGLVERIYGLKVISYHQMVSYDDRNFHIKAASDEETIKEYTLKITNSMDSDVPRLIESIVEIQRIIDASGGRVKVPIPVATLNGDHVVRLKAIDLTDEVAVIEKCVENSYAVHMLTYLLGTTLYHVPYTANVLNQYGQLLANLSYALQEVKTKVSDVLENRRSLWSLYNLPKLLPFLEALKSNGFESDKVALIETCVKSFEEIILTNDLFKKLPKIVIHGDYNEHNVIVDNSEKDSYKVYGVLDFTDCHFAPRIFEISIAIAYAMIESKLLDPLVAAGHVLAGYQFRAGEFDDVISPLDDAEIDLIKVCVQGRLAQSLTMGAYTILQDQSNGYVLSSAARGWPLLKRLVETDTSELKAKWSDIVAVYEGDSLLCYETEETRF